MPSRFTSADLPIRALVFLRAAATHPGIQAELARAGFSEADHREGWSLLGRACAWDDVRLDPAVDSPAREARREISAFVRDHFPRLRAAVERTHPEHAALFDFDRVAAGDDVVMLTTWLDRVRDVAESGVLDLLERRGVSEADRRRLAEQVTVAVSLPAVPAVKAERPDRTPELDALHRWHREWSLAARAVVKRKDWLITLGLTRRSAKAREVATGHAKESPATDGDDG